VIKIKIAISGSMLFSKEMLKKKTELEKLNHKVTIPKNAKEFAENKIEVEDKWKKLEIDAIRSYFNEIKKCDSILVLNITKNNIENYIGGNSLIEIAFAHVLKKKIFLYNPAPKMSYTDEIISMKPIIINQDIKKIK